MSLCIALAATVLTIPTMTFSLSWEHSVEKVEWREEWAVTGAGLELRRASVKGSGAGMEPGEGAVLQDGWWRWKPALAPVSELRLASSGATSSGWTLCHAGGCQALGDAPGREAVLSACEQDSGAVEPSR
ncbi:hypothetical protein QWE_13653 [Agrobacterium albertimagni AOL15]|uniref:DUF1850 domain-containing protein n=1 Tax=Agrobacterium albertimagni AOL15 TaxID=1156935 RepID=K2QE91_9HYPH|nr:DUF1850 domain-containing protein [Agrobacterium albertimagni]EKF59301.1 hypothetical protein QWE_13653 [Agrobacterium albertimagni AOL15]